MDFTIKEKQFTYVYDYKCEKHIRHGFNALAQKVYGFNFEQWYQDGYWQDRYIPHSLLFEGTVIANVSVNIIDFNLYEEKRRYIQIGTVMTDPEFRNMGLSRFLMEKVMEKWIEQCDMMYLFANDSVLDFYPKFGFVRADEYQLSKELNRIPPVMSAKKLDMDDSGNRQSLIEKISRAKSVSALGMIDNTGLIMFYCTSFMKNNVYHISEYDAYVIAEFNDGILYLQDLFCEIDLPLDKVIDAVAPKNIKKVVIGFTPKSSNSFDKHLSHEENTTLFILGRDAERFRNLQVMFPILSRA